MSRFLLWQPHRFVLVALGLLVVGCTVQPQADPTNSPVTAAPPAGPAATLVATAAAPEASSGEAADSPQADGATPTPARTGPPDSEPEPPDRALWEEGLAVYQAQSCGVCHTYAAAQSTGTFGPPHDGLAETALLRLQDPRYRGAATTPAEYVRESILQPEAYRMEGYQMARMPMPAYTHLSTEEVNALVIFLLSEPPQAVRP